MPRKRRQARQDDAGRRHEAVDADDMVRQYYENPGVSGEAERETDREGIEVDRSAGSRRLQARIRQHTDRHPDLSAGDLDAAWDRADAGEETVSGSSPTPDQDIVDELGEAIGVTYQDDEPLAIDEKLAKRDDQRWELDPASAEDYSERHHGRRRKK